MDEYDGFLDDVLDNIMWEILVPASKQNKPFSYEHHKKWDEYVKNISGGLTIMKSVKGEWLNPEGILHKDKMIPCRIVCNIEEINEIIDFTIIHYDQEAVIAYKIASNVILKHRK